MLWLHFRNFLALSCLIIALTTTRNGFVSAVSTGTRKNLVVLIDGTGLSINADKRDSNVVRLFQMLEQEKDQRVFYCPGIGTPNQVNAWQLISTRFRCVFGMVTGAGLDDDVLRGYHFLVENYEKGDRIFLFGFSRGGYAARVLAGLINVVGVLHRDQRNLLPYAYLAYKKAENFDGGVLSPLEDVRGGLRQRRHRAMMNKEEEARRISAIAKASRPDIHFVGAWDAVSSVYVPRPDRFMIPSALELPYTRENDKIIHFRQAAAIDERRRMFRLSPWSPANGDKSYSTDTKQMWFPGCHGDVGGGWPEAKSGLAKNSLLWMVDEAMSRGLKVNRGLFEKIVLGKGGEEGGIIAPNSLARVNQSMKTFSFWRLLEVLPKDKSKREWQPWWKRPAVLLGLYYFPCAEPRLLSVFSEDSSSSLPAQSLHDSVYERMDGDPKYRPPNVMRYLKEVRTLMHENNAKPHHPYQKYMKFLEEK